MRCEGIIDDAEQATALGVATLTWKSHKLGNGTPREDTIAEYREFLGSTLDELQVSLCVKNTLTISEFRKNVSELAKQVDAPIQNAFDAADSGVQQSVKVLLKIS